MGHQVWLCLHRPTVLSDDVHGAEKQVQASGLCSGCTTRPAGPRPSALQVAMAFENSVMDEKNLVDAL